MNATAANLIERALPPQTGLRQIGADIPVRVETSARTGRRLFGSLTRIFVETVQTFYASRAAKQGQGGAKTGAVSAARRTSPDLRLNPHLHVAALDGAYHEGGGELVWEGLGHLKTSEVGEVLERRLCGSRDTFVGAVCSGSTRTGLTRTGMAISSRRRLPR